MGKKYVQLLVAANSTREAEGNQARRFEYIVTKYYALNYICSGEEKASLGFFFFVA